VSDFEKGMGLGAKAALDVKALAGSGGGSGVGARKEGDKKRIEGLQAEAEERALRKIEEEQIEARKAKLAAFWLPSLTPEAKLAPVKDMKLQTMCHVGGQQHPLS
jgi:nitric oxide synthase-interacting protein